MKRLDALKSITIIWMAIKLVFTLQYYIVYSANDRIRYIIYIYIDIVYIYNICIYILLYKEYIGVL